jgi:hypothetical protein
LAGGSGYQIPRRLDRALFLKLAACDWRAERCKLALTGRAAWARAGSPARSATRRGEKTSPFSTPAPRTLRRSGHRIKKAFNKGNTGQLNPAARAFLEAYQAACVKTDEDFRRVVSGDRGYRNFEGGLVELTDQLSKANDDLVDKAVKLFGPSGASERSLSLLAEQVVSFTPRRLTTMVSSVWPKQRGKLACVDEKRSAVPARILGREPHQTCVTVFSDRYKPHSAGIAPAFTGSSWTR